MHANYASDNRKRDNVKSYPYNFHIVKFSVVIYTSIISMHFFVLINSTYNAL